MSDPEPSIRRPRRSMCADAALRAEIKRISQMTVEERINAALTMRGRFDWIRTRLRGLDRVLEELQYHPTPRNTPL